MKNKEVTKTRTLNAMVAQGMSMKVKPLQDGQWLWEVKRGAKVMDNGTASSQERAHRAVGKCIGTAAVQLALSSQERQALRQKLRGWAEKRTYVVMHVMYALGDGQQPHDIENSAADEERRLWQRDRRYCDAGKLPEHHLAKPANQLARELCEVARKLGLVGKRAYSWGCDNLGWTFSHPEMTFTQYTDLMFKEASAKKGKRSAEMPSEVVEDEDDDVEAATPDTAGDE